jgi:hypothetical protein
VYPPQVPQACLILSSAYVKAPDVTGVRTGFGGYEDDPNSPLQVVKHLLWDFAPHCDDEPERRR